MRYEPYDIVLLHAKYGARILAIIDVDEHGGAPGYQAIRLDKAPFRKRYRLQDDHIADRIGRLEPRALDIKVEMPPAATPAEWQAGQLYALFMAQHAETEVDRLRWKLLASLKTGQCVPIVRVLARRIKVEHHRFQTVLAGDRNYQFLARNANGTAYKWELSSVWLGADQPAARQEAQKMLALDADDDDGEEE